MRIKILYFFLLFLCFACNKDSFNSIPTINFISGIAYISGFVIEYELKDKEGDIGDSIFLIKKIINQSRKDENPTTLNLKLPDINKTSNLKAKIELSLDRVKHIGDNDSRFREDDTIVYGAYIKDNANHISDTAYAIPLILKKQ